MHPKVRHFIPRFGGVFKTFFPHRIFQPHLQLANPIFDQRGGIGVLRNFSAVNRVGMKPFQRGLNPVIERHVTCRTPEASGAFPITQAEAALRASRGLFRAHNGCFAGVQQSVGANLKQSSSFRVFGAISLLPLLASLDQVDEDGRWLAANAALFFSTHSINMD